MGHPQKSNQVSPTLAESTEHSISLARDLLGKNREGLVTSTYAVGVFSQDSRGSI